MKEGGRSVASLSSQRRLSSRGKSYLSGTHYVASDDGFKQSIEKVTLDSHSRVIEGELQSKWGGVARTNKVVRVASQRECVESAMMKQAAISTHRERYARAYAQR